MRGRRARPTLEERARPRTRRPWAGGILRPLAILLLSVVVVAVPGVPVRAAVVVLAPGEPFGREHVWRLFAEDLPPAPPGGRVELRVRRPALPLPNPSATPIRLVPVDWDLDPASGRFRGVVEAVAEGGGRTTLVLMGEVRMLVPVPVPRRPVPAGARLEAGMLETVERPLRTLPAEVVREVAALEGLEARRRLPAGRPIRRDDVGPPRLVRRGEAVTVVYRRGALELLLTARALEDGGLGEVVRLINPDSRRSLRARVTGPREAVAVGGGG